MELSSKGLEFIKNYEKLLLQPENDEAGNPTIGYGHKILPGEKFTRLTEAEALNLLARDVGKAVGAVNAPLKVSVSQHQFDALVSLAFNIGRNQFSRSAILARINAGRVVTRAHFIAWNKVTQNGRKVPSRGLTNRRLDEFEMFAFADYRRDH